MPNQIELLTYPLSILLHSKLRNALVPKACWAQQQGYCNLGDAFLLHHLHVAREIEGSNSFSVAVVEDISSLLLILRGVFLPLCAGFRFAIMMNEGAQDRLREQVCAV